MMEIDIKSIEESFIFSMMTVRDEQKDKQKYDYLVYIEF